jgi:hypothetical protein
MIQDKFIDGFIEDVYEIGEENNNIFWIRGNEGDTEHIKTNKSVEFIGNNEQEIKERLNKINPSDNIFVHWYDEFIAELVYDLPNKLFVFFWGGEMFEIPYWHHFYWLFDKKTSKYLLKINAPKIQLNSKFFQTFYNRAKYILFPPKDELLFLRRLKHLQNIDYFICNELDTEEVNLIRKLYPNSNFKHLPAFYDVNFDLSLSFVAPPPNEIIKVLLGNSATFTNNHLDAFEKLKKLNLDIYCPLSYGRSSVQELITNKGNQLFGNAFKPILNFMNRNEYCGFLNSMDIVFMYHNRQQAWGNIATALALGKPVFLKKNNPLWQFIHAMGLSCYDAEKIAEYDLPSLIEIERNKREENVQKLKLHISKEKRLQDLKNIFEHYAN